MKFIVQAQDRTAQGFNHVICAGRFFPSSNPTTVEVMDQDEDVMLPPAKAGYPDVADLNHCGRLAWQRILKDKRLSIRPEGSEVDGDLAPKLAAARSQIELLEGKLGSKEGECTAMKVELDTAKAQLAKANAEASELRDLLAAFDKPKTETPTKGKAKGEK